MDSKPLGRLKGREVIALCQGIVYRGVFRGADEEFAYLMGETGWRVLPLDRLSYVREPSEPPPLSCAPSGGWQEELAGLEKKKPDILGKSKTFEDAAGGSTGKEEK